MSAIKSPAASSILSRILPPDATSPTLAQLLYPTPRILARYRLRGSSTPQSNASSSGSSSGPKRIALPNPFSGSVSSTTGAYSPPRISGRKRADLVRFFGKERLPAPYGNVEEEEWDEAGSAADGAGQAGEGGTHRVRIRWVNPRGGTSRTTSTSSISSSSVSTPLLPTHGPYAGRSPTNPFKGHAHVRAKIQREKDAKERMDGVRATEGDEVGKEGEAMRKRVDEWRQAKKEAIASAKPSLPF